MLRDFTNVRQSDEALKTSTAGADRRLQVILWTLWTLAVVVAGFLRWRANVAAGQPIDMLGIVVYAALAGMIGLVVLTMIEIWLEPQRFVD